MRAREFINEELSQDELQSVERFADSLWKKLGINVDFSKHFIERVNDERNGKPISAAELVRIFKKEYERYGKKIANMDDHEAVMKDAFTKINLPFVISDRYDHRELVAKTIMRKNNFLTRGQEFVVNEVSLPKNQWEMLISNADKEEVGHDLVSLVQKAYNNTPDGSFVNSIRDVIPSDWNVIDWDQDPDVDSTVFYRINRPDEAWHGHKIQGLGHDGTRTSKDKAIAKIQSLLSKKGWWIESSDAMRHILKKLNTPAIADEKFLQALFKDPTLKMIDQDTYERTLPSGKKVKETVFGNPNLK